MDCLIDGIRFPHSLARGRMIDRTIEQFCAASQSITFLISPMRYYTRDFLVGTVGTPGTRLNHAGCRVGTSFPVLGTVGTESPSLRGK